MSEPLMIALKNTLRRRWPFVLCALVLLLCVGPVISYFNPKERRFFHRANIQAYVEEQLPRNSSYSYVVHWLESHGIESYHEGLQRGFVPLDEEGIARVIYLKDGWNYSYYELELHFSAQRQLKDIQWYYFP